MESSHSAKDSPASPAAAANILLVGNSFPLSLIRRLVTIRPAGCIELQAAAASRRLVSFWGHASTLAAASRFVGFDLTPACARPVLSLDTDGYPSYDGNVFRECWVVSPDYVANFRQAVGQEVSPEMISGWQVLHLLW